VLGLEKGAAAGFDDGGEREFGEPLKLKGEGAGRRACWRGCRGVRDA
jgi:hypothetical protein